MTLPEWTTAVIKNLQEAGFTVREYEGFPLVERPPTMAESIRLLKHNTGLGAKKTIYAEGMLFTPDEARA